MLLSGIDSIRVVDTGTVKSELAIFVSLPPGAYDALTAYDALVGTSVVKLITYVLPSPLVSVKFGLVNEPDFNNEPVFVAVPTADDAVTNNCPVVVLIVNMLLCAVSVNVLMYVLPDKIVEPVT